MSEERTPSAIMRVTDAMIEAAMDAAEVPEEERAGVAQYFEQIVRAALASAAEGK